MKDVLMTGGWSAVGGQVGLFVNKLEERCHSLPMLQTQSPYVRGGVIPNATCFGHSVSPTNISS